MSGREERRHPTKDRKQPRSEFQRDRDRVLYSDAFRRLAGVTQVVHVGEGHAFHNRLTHSLKVAQFGRRLAEYLKAKHAELVIDPDVVETACLGHDLGHPPFGHIAEHALDECLVGRGVTDGYDGNAQALRIVTRLAVRGTDHEGLNLTRATLNALLKYPWSRGTGGKKKRKWGHFFTETEDFEFARVGMLQDQRSLEAEVMDWADDVTYAVHDVEDFFEIGVIPLDRLLLRATHQATPELEDFAKFCVEEDGRLTREQVVGVMSLLGDFAPDELLRPFSGTRASRGALRAFSSKLITRYLVEVRADDQKFAVPQNVRTEIDVLQKLMPRFVYRHPALAAQQYGQRKIIEGLFEIFRGALGSRDALSIVPTPYREFAESADSDERRARLAADIVASMTEPQAYAVFARLSGADPGTVIDQIIR